MRASGIGFGLRLLLIRAGMRMFPASRSTRSSVSVTASVKRSPTGAAEGHDALHPLGQPGGESEQFLVVECLTFPRLDADGIDFEDPDVDLLPARLCGAECGLEELELVAGRGGCDGGASGDVVLDLPAP